MEWCVEIVDCEKQNTNKNHMSATLEIPFNRDMQEKIQLTIK